MLVTHFYSDPHFGHANVIDHASRPFGNATQMDSELIRRYSESVGPTDTVLWLGDCFFCPMLPAEMLLRRLPGHKILVLGNHDRNAARMAKLGFDLVVEHSLYIHIAGRRVRVCHYPPRGKQRKGDRRYEDRMPVLHKGELIIHGHTHEKRRRDGNRIHVGVDAWDFAPAPFADVERLVGDV